MVFSSHIFYFFFFFNDTATTEIYTLSLTTLFRSGTTSAPRGRRASRAGRGPGRSGWTAPVAPDRSDRKSTRLNSSHTVISYAVFCLKKKKQIKKTTSLKLASDID